MLLIRKVSPVGCGAAIVLVDLVGVLVVRLVMADVVVEVVDVGTESSVAYPAAEVVVEGPVVKGVVNVGEWRVRIESIPRRATAMPPWTKSPAAAPSTVVPSPPRFPSNVTNAFSAMHERPAALNFETREAALRGTEKLDCAATTSLGISCPMVTLFILLAPSVSSVTVVQPMFEGVVQSVPVKLLAQMHEHTP